MGSALKGRVIVVDDVISAGTSVRESVEIIRGSGAALGGVLIALDRQERGTGTLSAVQEVRETTGAPVLSICRLADLVAFLGRRPGMAAELRAVESYRERYGVHES